MRRFFGQSFRPARSPRGDGRVAFVCPDLNIELSIGRLERVATGGGKAALLQLASAFSRAGLEVTVAGALAEPGRLGNLTFIRQSELRGEFDAIIFVTGSRGDFDGAVLPGVSAGRRVFWINAPQRVAPPPGPIDWYIIPSRFLARTAIEEWGFPPERVVVIPGGAVLERVPPPDSGRRDPFRVVYASHPAKGLANAVEILSSCIRYWPSIRLDVFGSERLWGDNEKIGSLDVGRPSWVTFLGDVAKLEIERRMSDYGLMIYVTEWVDSFSPVCSEAMAGGAIPIATAHGATAEIIRHGWNGFLVGAPGGKPNLEEATHLASTYFGAPDRFAELREHAALSIPTWDEQAKDWMSVILEREPLSRS